MIWIYYIQLIGFINQLTTANPHLAGNPGNHYPKTKSSTKPVFSWGMFIGRNPFMRENKITVSWKAICYPMFFFGNAPILSVNLLQTTNLPFSKSSSTLNWRYLAPPNRCLMSCSQLASVIWIRAIPSFQLVQCQEWNVTWMAFFFIMMLAPTHHCQRWEYKRVLNFIELPSFCDTFRIFFGWYLKHTWKYLKRWGLGMIPRIRSPSLPPLVIKHGVGKCPNSSMIFTVKPELKWGILIEGIPSGKLT